MPAKFIFRIILVVSVALLALILNAEGKLLANETPLLMILVVLFISGGAVLNFVQIKRWRQQQTNGKATLESFNSAIVEDKRLVRYYRRWLVAMPVLYIVGLFTGPQTPLWMRVLFTAFAICAYIYVLFAYTKAKHN
jgi:hypothetical protein